MTKSDVSGSSDTLWTWIAVICAPTNVSHRQRLHKIENPGRERQQQVPNHIQWEEMVPLTFRMNGNYLITELSCIGRWVIQPIFWWGLDVIDQCMIAKDSVRSGPGTRGRFACCSR